MKDFPNKSIAYIIGFLLIVGIVLTSYSLFFGTLIVIFLLLSVSTIADKEIRYYIVSVASLLIGFLIFQVVSNYLASVISNKEMIILLNRLSLIFVVFSLIIVSYFFRKPIKFYHNKPIWNRRIYFPYITHGFHSIRASVFLAVALIINLAIFIPVVSMSNNLSDIKEMLWFVVLFSLLNSVLEEVIWRGILLKRLSEGFTVKYALLITSVAFGLQHIAIGIPFFVSLTLSLGGLFYGIVVIRTNSIYPAIIWHFIINMGMVLSGWIV